MFSHQISNHQPTDTLSHNLHNRNGPTFRDHSTGRHDGPAHGCAGPYIQGRSGLPAYQTGDEACGITDRGHARVADGRIQPAQLSVRPANGTSRYSGYSLHQQP